MNGPPPEDPADYARKTYELTVPVVKEVDGQPIMRDGVQVAAAEVILRFTSRCSGDNYEVEAALADDVTGLVDWMAEKNAGRVASILLIAWKRIYVEDGRMYRKGSDLAVTAWAGQTWVTVVDAADLDLSAGDELEIMDRDSRETAYVGWVDGNTTNLVAPLGADYVPGYEPGDGAAVARVTGDDSVDVYRADLESPQVLYAYGACFVELVRVGDIKRVPYRDDFGLYDETDYSKPLVDFANVWSQYHTLYNCLFLCGARCGYSNKLGLEGIAVLGGKGGWLAFVFQPQVNSLVTAHEMGHVILDAGPGTDEDHAGTWRPCLMTEDMSSGVFCVPHASQIRTQEDPFHASDTTEADEQGR